jgi:hypothetical protein
MATSNTGTRTETSYQFELSHGDIVDMMNDPQVLLQGGDVAGNQVFAVFLKKGNGTHILLKDMKASDTLVFRFTVVERTDDGETFSGVDIQD